MSIALIGVFSLAGIGLRADSSVQSVSAAKYSIVSFMKNVNLSKPICPDENTVLLFIAQSSTPYKRVSNPNRFNDFVLFDSLNDGVLISEFNKTQKITGQAKASEWDGVARYNRINIPDADAMSGVNAIYKKFNINWGIGMFSIYRCLPKCYMVFSYALFNPVNNCYDQYLYYPTTGESCLGATHVCGWFNIHDYPPVPKPFPPIPPPPFPPSAQN